MSKVNDTKNRIRRQKQTTPSAVLAEPINEESNVVLKEEKKIERKRVSFDLRTDLHKQLKMQSIMQEKNIYILIEEALDNYLKDTK